MLFPISLTLADPHRPHDAEPKKNVLHEVVKSHSYARFMTIFSL